MVTLENMSVVLYIHRYMVTINKEQDTANKSQNSGVALNEMQKK